MSVFVWVHKCMGKAVLRELEVQVLRELEAWGFVVIHGVITSNIPF